MIRKLLFPCFLPPSFPHRPLRRNVLRRRAPKLAEARAYSRGAERGARWTRPCSVDSAEVMLAVTLNILKVRSEDATRS